MYCKGGEWLVLCRGLGEMVCGRKAGRYSAKVFGVGDGLLDDAQPGQARMVGWRRCVWGRGECSDGRSVGRRVFERGLSAESERPMSKGGTWMAGWT